MTSEHNLFTGEKVLTLFDGAIGTQLQQYQATNEVSLPDLLNIHHPEIVKQVHRSYLQAGAHIITTNTFSSNPIRLSGSESDQNSQEIAAAGVQTASKATRDANVKIRDQSRQKIAGSIGPTGKMFPPAGTLSYDQVSQSYLKQAKAMKSAGADWIIVETMESSRELKAAVTAAQEAGFPVVASFSFSNNGLTTQGISPKAAAVIAESIGVDVLSANCGTGPEPYPSIVKEYNNYTTLPISIEPNAGQPQLVDGEPEYKMSPTDFLKSLRPALPYLSGVGSCCGSRPQFTKQLSKIVADYGQGQSSAPTDQLIASKTQVTSAQSEYYQLDLELPGKVTWKEHTKTSGVPLLNLDLYEGDPRQLERDLPRFLTINRISSPIGFRSSKLELLTSCLKAYPGIPPISYSGKTNQATEPVNRLGGVLIDD